ncbi:hypothetical protein ACQEWB_20580 [Streptomyces sp. CA-249302]|uniref:hypothetical protein n=1 Tax=Streptomyces sp. CA-249302 TaxID=3240058 RepID=UPI003D8EB550
MSRARAARAPRSPFAAVKKFVADVLLWSFFAVGLGMSAGGAGAFLDGTAKTAATIGGGVVALIAGSRITKKPKIKAFLGRPGTLWFLFLFNGGTAAALYFTMDGAKGIIGAACMGLVSLGALGGLIAGRRARREAAQAAAEAPYSETPWA